MEYSKRKMPSKQRRHFLIVISRKKIMFSEIKKHEIISEKIVLEIIYKDD